MKTFFLLLSVMALSSISQAQNMVGNGGDVVASEFNSIARTAVYFLQKKSLSTSDQNIVSDIQKKIETTLVESVNDELSIDGRVVDAINYPELARIKVNRKRWEQIRLRNPSERAMIVLHEYIWIAGTNDGNYAVSTRLTKEIENDLDKNSISTEKYQVALAQLYTEVALFLADVLGMQAAGATDFPAFCYAVGSLKAHAVQSIQLTRENSFWFSVTQRPTVDESVDLIQTFTEQQVAGCRYSTPVDFETIQTRALNVSEAIKYLIMITQFPESSL